MKLCIYGAGAIGGLIGAELSLAGSDVTLIARGPHLEAIRQNGLTLINLDETRVVYPVAIANPEDAGPQDYIVITLKAHSVPGIVEAIQPLIGAETTVVWGVNGVPWWYFYKLDGEFANQRLETIDPGGVQWDRIGPARIVASVIYPAAEVIEPGVIKHVEGNRISLGEPSGEKSHRVEKLAAELTKAGFRTPIRSRIRDELWVKLWGNLSFNPISALTGSTLEEMCNEPDTLALIRAMMCEAQQVGEKIGVKFPVNVDKRIDGGRAVGAHKTSMLQDLERGRPMEIDALIGAVAEMAELTATPIPNINTVLALVKMRGRLAGCYNG